MIDTHIHLNHEDYKNDLEEVIQRSKKENVKKVVVIGCDYQGILKAIEILKKDKDDFIYVALGWHPVDAKDFKDEYLELIKELIVKYKEKVVAIGEIGLDYHWYPKEKELQKEIFKKQIKLAKKLDLPIIIHARESYDDCYEVLCQEGYFKGVMHSFADDYKSAKRFIDKGMYIGISGPVTFKNGDNQKEVIKNIDLSKLVLETDGPYLTPVPHRGKRNESIYIKYIIEEISKIRNIEYKEIEKITDANSKILFKIGDLGEII